MKNIVTNYKLRISFIIIVGFFIVSLITAIAAYSIYQNTLLEYRSESNKIIKIYENNYNNVIKDLEYLKLIDFEKTDQEIIEQFKKISKLVYDKNRFTNGINLVKQFKKEELEKENQNLSQLLSNNNIKIFPITDKIKKATPSKEDGLYSVVFSRTPFKVDKSIIGAELSSEYNRQVIIASMNFTDSYYLTAPVSLVNDSLKGFEYSSVLYYPLYKEKEGKYYKWYVTIPMTSQKVLNRFLKEHYYFNDFNIHIYDKNENYEETYICICTNSEDQYPSKIEEHIISKHIIKFANRERKMIITTDSLFTFGKYWTVILGFISGIIFLIGIGYYLLYKEEKEIEIKHLSRTDHLTQVYNRIYFDEQIEHAIEQYKRYGQSFSIILLDIDYFKTINDRYGHIKGDEVLIMLTKLLSSSIRKSDMVARWGGEEFAILLPNTSSKIAFKIAEKLRVKIETYTFCSEFAVTCSFGVTQIEQNDNEEILFNRADSALYTAKQGGRNRVELNTKN